MKELQHAYSGKHKRDHFKWIIKGSFEKGSFVFFLDKNLIVRVTNSYRVVDDHLLWGVFYKNIQKP